ncbi:MAG TPA: type II CAAX endopeptidase family protein [Rhizomicrobium sp.]|nr:type II CAAX endopeptidase family protein [Rhizomicrobium sp.]
MRNLLKSLPLGAEFIFVISVAFGGSILGSLFMAIRPPSGAPVTEPHLWGLILNEVVVFGVLGFFLYARDWTFERLGFRFRWSDPLWAFVLVVGVYVAFYAAWYALSYVPVALLHTGAPGQIISPGISPQTVIALVIVNPVFEEVFVAGYVIAALKDVRGTTFAINVSVVIRLVYHLYQGISGVLSIIPMGLIFGYWFARKGRLWPLIAAHALLDLVPFLYMVKF